MRNDFIVVFAQGYYGNRTITEVKKDKIVDFLDSYNEKNDIVIQRIPTNKDIVIVYNRESEKNVEEDMQTERYKETIAMGFFGYRVLACIPELNIELRSRCFFARIDENGELCSIEDGDFQYFGKYVTA